MRCTGKTLWPTGISVVAPFGTLRTHHVQA